MGLIDVDPGQVASVGSSIEGDASGLDFAVQAMAGLAGPGEPAETARALTQLQTQWSAGVRRLRDDLEALGRGTQAASTLYTHTDETAMAP